MKVIAITGGPCAGKTSAMDVLRAQLERAKTPAVFVPEAATDLIQAGIAPWTCPSTLDFQTRVIALQLEREAVALEDARARNALVICDRGVCDSHAYLTDEEFAHALAANGMTHAQALARYDAVFHLESIATTNPAAYTAENNSARFENADEAAFADRRGKSAWANHPAFHVLGNFATFEEKAEALWHAIARFIDADAIPRDHAPSGPILVSACLLGELCRYDGNTMPCEQVMNLAGETELIPVCPEQLGGLPTPRTPSEIQPDGRVVNARGDDVTAAFEAGAAYALLRAREHGCNLAILKENSPSCGVNTIYDGTFSGTIIAGKGKTAELLARAGIDTISEADVERLPEATAQLLP